MRVIASVAATAILSSCALPDPDRAEQAGAEAAVRARFGPDALISRLSRTTDNSGFCGMLLRDAVTDYAVLPVFIVEASNVTILGTDPALYERCGPGYVAPVSIPPVA